MAYVQRVPVRFPDVDFAQIVYYPRLFDYVHQVYEDFFGAEVGVPYPVMLGQRRVAYPAVHAEADFKAPLRYGDVARVVMEATKVSTKSVTSRYRLYRDGSEVLCAELRVVTASIDMDRFLPIELPADVRAAFLRHQARD